MSSFRKAFTLIELLLVVALMALMMGIALPAFSKMAKGNGVTITSRNLSAKINGARSYAASKRAYVALLFPTNDTESVPDKVKYVSCRPALLAGSNCSFVSWIDGESWERMPAGVSFGGAESGGSVSALTAGAPGNNNTLRVTLPKFAFNDIDSTYTSTSSNVEVNALVFAPDGTTLNSYFNFCIWEATPLTAGGSPKITNLKNGMKISVNPYTGRILYLPLSSS